MNLTAGCIESLTSWVRASGLGILVTAVVLSGATTVRAKDIFPFMVTTRTLENGLSVVLVPFDSPGIVAYYTIVRAGSRNEVEAGKSGFAHFFEHMMFRGTDRYSSEEYGALFKSLGSDANAYTSDDVTVYHMLFGKDGLEKVIDAESDRFMRLKYTEPAFKQESKAVLGEYSKNYANPENKLYEKVRETAFTTHTYGHTTMGFLADIKAMPDQYAYSLEFFKRFYTPSNCVVMVVGDFEMHTALELITKYYGVWDVPHYEPKIPAEPAQTETRTAHIDWENETLPYVAVAFRMPAFDAKTRDSASMDILASLLYDETSPLYRDLVIREQIVDELNVYAPFRRDPGLFLVYARVKDPRNLTAVRDRIYQTAFDAARTPADPARLAAIKSNIRYSFAMSLDTARSVAGHLTRFIGLTGEPGTINEMYKRYDEVTTADLQKAAATYFTRTSSTEVTLTGGAK